MGLGGHLPSTAGRSLMLVACSVPASSMVPRALTHLPSVIASLVAAASLVYLVASSTVTAVCAVLPLGSVVVTLMVLPVTEATAPRIGFAFAGGGGGEPGEPAGGRLPGGHAPLTAGMIFTDAAVTGWPGPAPGSVGRTRTQLPAVTSVSAAGVTSVTLVVEVKFTAAFELSSLVTWIELPATEAIRPLTWASPLGVGDVVVEVTVDGETDVDVGLDLFDEPHAATDSAVAPVMARTAKRVSRDD